MQKGFVTIATGQNRYYQLALNLLHSYKCFCKEPLPFCLMCDNRNNDVCKEFDNVIVLDNPQHSYMDKIELLNNIPYDETIYIEADCLFYDDGNKLFEAFSSDDYQGFSTQGRKMPRDAKDGWFRIEECGKYTDKIQNTNRMHSGMIYLQKNNILCQKMYEICKDVNDNYDQYMFGGNRDGLDDKLFSISSQYLGLNLLPFNNELFIYYPGLLFNKQKVILDIEKGIVNIFKDDKKIIDKSIVVHWSNWLTTESLYKREIEILDSLLENRLVEIDKIKKKYRCSIYISNLRIFLEKKKELIIDKASKINILKNIYHIFK